ncbi:DUF5776 domain-containing protein [Lentilactobacillus sunkii]|uniref:DUF5776 domain-containing protein n=1 Tax=Lentilactobacillus sunkii DSM 19904 TaxID=1423808 RepID=A0A0R1KZZ4_9LACO|nr:DUF5776 domain-containing protein [Lentilactobacillus sunkii]KRK87027.1 hypothetical protein FD17_GL001488 [Lentilactobacillus sunkii DSM 19904]
MSDQTGRLSLTRAVRWLVTFVAAFIFGGLLIHQSAIEAADNEVTYTLHSMDINGNHIHSSFNNKQVMVPISKYDTLDVSKEVPLTFNNGRYVLKGYHTDNKSEQHIMYYEELNQKTDSEKLKRLADLNVYNPHRAADDKEVNVYFAYQDTQNPLPETIKLTPDALQREAGKIKIFYTDVNGKELKPSIKYDFDKVPDPDSSFQMEFDGYRYIAAVIRNPKPYGTYVYSDSKMYANMETNVDDLLFQAILQPNYMRGIAMRPKQHASGSTATFVYEKYAANLTIEYLDESGKAMADHPAQTKQLPLNTGYSEEAPEIAGYTVVGDKKVAGKISDDTKITFKYKKNTVPPTPNNNKGSNSTITPATNSSSNTGQSTNATNNQMPTPRTLPDGTQLPNYAATEGTVVYATKAIYMYKHANFKKNQRIAKYPKAKRVNRPMFVVTDYARSNGGALRYKVKDVNHHSKTAGKVGYITANRKSVEKVYYASMPKNKKMTVISKKGVNVYKNANLTKKVKNYKTGSHLKVKKIVKHNLTTRYELSNGYYMTANKKLVIHGIY